MSAPWTRCEYLYGSLWPQKKRTGSILLQNPSFHAQIQWWASKPMSFTFPFFLPIKSVDIVQHYIPESLYLHNPTRKIWTQNELTPQDLNEHWVLISLLGSCVFQSSCLPCDSCQRWGAVGCCLPGCQPAFLGRSNAYCWSSQVGCSWSGASEDAPVSPIKTSHKVAGLLDSTHHLSPKSHFSVTGVFII